MNVQQLQAIHTREEVIARIPAFREAVQNEVNAYFAKNLTNLLPDKISAEVKGGTKFCRIIKIDSVNPGNLNDYTSRGVWGFIDLSNGDILKAAGWKAPAKHARGNIFDADFSVKNWSAYGPRYL